MCQCNGLTASSNNAQTIQAVAGAAAPTVLPDAPLASPIDVTIDSDGLPAGTAAPPGMAAADPIAGPVPIPPFHICRLDFRDGCYAMTFRPAGIFFQTFRGTLRVDRAAPDGGPDRIIVSGDLYRDPLVIDPSPLALAGAESSTPIAPGTGDRTPPTNISGGSDAPAATLAPPASRTASAAVAAPASVAGAVSRIEAPVLPLPWLVPKIPIFARARYHSYLRVTSVSVPI